MKLLTQVNWEIGLERDKKTSDRKLRITPLILPLEDHVNNLLQEIAKGSHYPGKGRNGCPRESQMLLPRGAGWGAGAGVYWVV